MNLGFAGSVLSRFHFNGRIAEGRAGFKKNQQSYTRSAVAEEVWASWFRGSLVVGTLVFSVWFGRSLALLMLVWGNSMEPTLKHGEMFRIQHRVPDCIQRGTIVVFSGPSSSSMVKRVIGLPGERVSFGLGEIFVNGKMLFEPYLPSEQTTFDWKHRTLRLGQNEYLVLGDNRRASQDSRDYGPILRSQIIGTIDIDHPCPRLLDKPNCRVLNSSPNKYAVLKKLMTSITESEQTSATSGRHGS